MGSESHPSYYTYDNNGNLLTSAEWRPQDSLASAANYRYNNFNQLTLETVNGTAVGMAYNADGIRTVKATQALQIRFMLDGDRVIAEVRYIDPTIALTVKKELIKALAKLGISDIVVRQADEIITILVEREE